MLLTAPDHEESVLNRTVAATERLIDFPRMGRLVPKLGEADAREIIVDQYHVIYSTDGDLVVIATILHGAMDITTRLRDLLGTES